MKKILNQLVDGYTLTQAEARAVLVGLATGSYNPSQVAAFLTIYLMRPMRVEELIGFRDAMLELCVRVDLHEYPAIDVCGTGGDGKNTFNISTLAAFVVAGAGVPVVKHGNYAVSSSSGSSDVLEALGVVFSNDVDRHRRSLDEANLCFLHAPLFHPAFKQVASIRRDLGVKTFFNMLGPLVNPAEPPCRMVGVFSLELARLYAYLHQLTSLRWAIVHSLDGYDEVSLTSPFRWINAKEEDVVLPEDWGFSQLAPDAIGGVKNSKEAAQTFMHILGNQGTLAQKNVVLANAGLAIATACGTDIRQGIEGAEKSLMEGRALRAFHRFLEINQ